MSKTAITYLVAGFSGVFSLAAWVWWILLPAVSSYRKRWEKAGAVVLSLYVLAALMGVGVLVGWVIFSNWTRVF